MKLTIAVVLCCLAKVAIAGSFSAATTISDNGYLDCLKMMDCITRTEARDYFSRPELARLHTEAVIIVLPERQIPAHVASSFLKGLRLQSRNASLPQGSLDGISNEDYARLLASYRYITQTEYEKILRHNYDMIDSTVVLQDRQLPASVLSRVMKSPAT
uniref:Uncharacterized protein n=1 Tax=Trichuris muris TaxID=70415 RepID=A0A5S6PYS4_TRIMR